MILAIDIGNTNIVVGCIDREKTYFIERLSTVRTKTELEYAVDLKTVVDIYHIKRADIEGCIISSVVPQITNAVKLAAEKVLHKEPMVLGPGVKTGLNIMMTIRDSLVLTWWQMRLREFTSIPFRWRLLIWELQAR